MPKLDNAHALIVGIADYANIRKLPKVRDAEDLAAALVDSELCGYDPKKVTACWIRMPHKRRSARDSTPSSRMRRELDRLPLLLRPWSDQAGDEQRAVPPAC